MEDESPDENEAEAISAMMMIRDTGVCCADGVCQCTIHNTSCLLWIVYDVDARE